MRITSSYMRSRATMVGECLVWDGAKKGKGYGSLRAGPRTIAAHRVSYCLANNVMLPSSIMVLHSCDNPACINPDHLRTGKHGDNMLDRAKRRRTRGAGSPKLSAADVVEIRKMYAGGLANQYELASKYGVRQGAIQAVVSGRTYGWVK